VTPEAAAYLDKAREDLNDARAIVAIGLAKAAARSAYYAAFHAAEAFIIDARAESLRRIRGFAPNLRDWPAGRQEWIRQRLFFWQKRTSIRKSAITAWGMVQL
jgi:hypothetical protein